MVVADTKRQSTHGHCWPEGSACGAQDGGHRRRGRGDRRRGRGQGRGPRNEVVVYTEFEDVAYSPCGIPYVHGKEIDTFERLFLAEKQAYVEAGIDVHYETRSPRST